MEPVTVGALPVQLWFAGVAVLLVQYLKNASWFPLVSKGNETANKVFAIIVAAAAATGIAYTTVWDAAAGTLVITVSGLSMPALWKAIWVFVQQFGWQQLAWKLLKEKLT